MDRAIGKVATVIADLPGGDDDVITITLTDPFGTVLVDADTPTSIGADRYTYTTLDPLTAAGVYQIDWLYTVAGNTVSQLFTVGRQPVVGISKYDLRIQIASFVDEVIRGTVSSAGTSSIADDTIVSAPERYNYRWIMLDAQQADAGRRFLIRGFNGSAFELNSTFIQAPVVGSRYSIFKIDPHELDLAMMLAINELAPQTRIDIRVEAITVTDDLATIPTGITHISEVWADGEKLLPTDWSMRPGRQIGFETTPSDPVDLIGQRVASFPVWEDSIIETDAVSTIARAAFVLHTGRASSSATDLDEHLRRQLAAADDYERARRTSVGRIRPGTRPVLE